LLQLPVEAVRPHEEIWVNRDGHLEIVTGISIVYTDGQTASVRATGSGLQAGDRVVVSPLPVVENGMPLQESGEAIQ
jgi:hypothetical protein